MELTERKKRILSSVVNNFVEYGEPVGSKTIADEIGVSSATIRNEMADLIQLGLLEQPYTSAGRVPSPMGYRKYVEGISRPQMPSKEDVSFFDTGLLENAYDIERLLRCVPKLLAEYSKLVSIVSTPEGRGSTVRGIQFVQISRRTAMLVLMSSVGTVSNRIFHCDYDLTVEILRMFFRVFNKRLNKMLISDITVAFIQSMAVSLGELSMLSAPPLVALLEVAGETMRAEIFIHGQMNLLMYPEAEYSNVRYIVSFLENRSRVRQLLDRRRYKKTTVLIGNETGRRELKDASVVMSSFFIGNQDAGTIALLGPMRMDYKRAISALEYVSNQLGDMLTALTMEI